MAPLPRLLVFHESERIGTLGLAPSGQMEFEYSPAWAASPAAFPLSFSLPLNGDFERGVADHRFFANLLPEAGARESLCRSLGISISNDYELLKRIGGDCAGALSIRDASVATGEGAYRPITRQELDAAVKTRIPSQRMTVDGEFRLSLAGAQDKWPVFLQRDELFFPEGGKPSSHILKFGNPAFKGLVWNETFVTFLAGRLGLPVMPVRVKDGYSLAQRYDRKFQPAGEVTRLHQEDFCQALGLPTFQKYQSEGGPGLGRCLDLVRAVSAVPAVDSMLLLRWQMLNVLLGNSDGHAKNLSLLYDSAGCRVSPFYDLVCTRLYDGVSRNLAMGIGAQHDPGQIRRVDWEALAVESKIKPGLVFRLLDELFQRLEGELDGLTSQFIEDQGANPAVDLVVVKIRKQVRRTKTLLAP